MKKSYLIIIGAVVVLGVAVGTVFQSNNLRAPERRNGLALAATVYKTPTCGCCHVYSEYLKREGVNVETKDVADLAPIKRQYGVPAQMESCHTSIFGDYVVEGHVPLEVVDKLLAEKPDIKGIALPGMPSGSPGMPGPKVGEWTIYALGHDGSVSEYMKY